jgi:ankyrin repeat protein
LEQLWSCNILLIPGSQVKVVNHAGLCRRRAVTFEVDDLHVLPGVGQVNSMDIVAAFCRALWKRDDKTVAALARRVDPNGRDRWGNTPLLMAARYGDASLVSLLVRRGADIDQQRTYLTPLTLAARRKDPEIVRVLQDNGATVSIATNLYLGDRKRCAQMLERNPALARIRDEEHTPILHHAAESLNTELVELLLVYGAVVSETDRNGETSLHRVADMRLAPQEPAGKMATLLLDRGADPNARNWDDVTPLHQGVRARNVAVVQVLLARGADPNARDKSRGSTPLRRAVSATGAGGTAGTAALMVPLARMLLERGADPDARDKRGIAVRASARAPDVRAVLEEYRGDKRRARGVRPPRD